MQHSHTPEEWRPVVGYEGYYEVSDHGRIRSLDRIVRLVDGRDRPLKGRSLVLSAHPKGYRTAKLSVHGNKQTVMIHRVVLQAFIGPRPRDMEVCHNDGDPANNRLGNLRYASTSANRYDSVEHGTHPWANRTHCPRGHEYTPENIYVQPSRPRSRSCWECKRARRKSDAARARQRQSARS